MKTIINFHKVSYGFDLTKEYSFAKGYDNIDTLYHVYLQNLGVESESKRKIKHLRAIK